MAKQKLRIKIKDLPRDILISQEERRKILGGFIIPLRYINSMPYITYMNAAHHH